MSRTERIDDDVDARVSDVPARAVGDVIAGRYRLVRVLGAGGMGTVYEAQHTFTHRRVAIKVIHRELATSPRSSSRFTREARVTASIGHPGIVDVLDGGRDDDGTLFLVVELLDGETLAARIAARALTPAEVTALAAETLAALAAAHAKGLVHRDIKPENIFLVRDADGAERVRLLDFGIVRQLDGYAEQELMQTGTDRTQTGAVVGTPYFMSPEQARGEHVDGRTDLWSLGAVMFYALTRQRPVQADNYNALIVRLATLTPPSTRAVLATVPEALASVIDRALDPDLDRRWSSAEAMAAALVARPAAPAPPPAASATLPSPAPPRRPWRASAAGLLAGLALGALGGRAMRPEHRVPPRVVTVFVPAPSAPAAAPPAAQIAPPPAPSSVAVVASPVLDVPTVAAGPSVTARPRGVEVRPGVPLRVYE